ncbi:hypothetical protein WOLCODRAFT_163846 [Wolfiporia cocos MD-104 SS10]|uniref:Uncharacterized protein n=1 Tax=Wolfiporia cocos (strain MD-104) TaxID=742152 RepID=A0A2H3JXD4_WOLCO|nr:hypothetical protein WOLCODRAFT_163846 [Wolfiporia cocos MD-104 SS10]
MAVWTAEVWWGKGTSSGGRGYRMSAEECTRLCRGPGSSGKRAALALTDDRSQISPDSSCNRQVCWITAAPSLQQEPLGTVTFATRNEGRFLCHDALLTSILTIRASPSIALGATATLLPGAYWGKIGLGTDSSCIRPPQMENPSEFPHPCTGELGYRVTRSSSALRRVHKRSPGIYTTYRFADVIHPRHLALPFSLYALPALHPMQHAQQGHSTKTRIASLTSCSPLAHTRAASRQFLELTIVPAQQASSPTNFNPSWAIMSLTQLQPASPLEVRYEDCLARDTLL